MDYKEWEEYKSLEEAVNNNLPQLQRLTLDELERLSNEYPCYHICRSRKQPTSLEEFKFGDNFQELINGYPRGKCGGMCIVNVGGRRMYFMWQHKPYFWFQPDEFADMYC